MSSAQGFPDWQRITQWLGTIIVQATGLVIGAGTNTDGPFQVSNFASVIVAVKPTGGAVTVTIKQTVPGGPASLVLSSSTVVAAGATLFEAIVLYGGAVELDITGTIAGTSVDYALYGSNTTTNAQLSSNPTLDIQHNGTLIGTEPTLDFEDAGANIFAVTNDPPNSRVKVTPPRIVTGSVSSAGALVAGTGFTVSRTALGRYTVTFSPAFASAPVVVVTPTAGLRGPVVVIDAPTTAGFHVFMANYTAGDEDDAFDFIAMPLA